MGEDVALLAGTRFINQKRGRPHQAGAMGMAFRLFPAQVNKPKSISQRVRVKGQGLRVKGRESSRWIDGGRGD